MSSAKDDLLLLYLPLAHNFGRLTHLLAPMAGYTIAFCADPYAVADALLKVRPTVFPSVPRVYEKVHTAVLARFDEATGAQRRLIDWALDVGRGERAPPEGQPVPRGLAVQHRLADRLVYSKVKARSEAACARRSPAVRRSPSRSSSSSTRSTSSSSRATASPECTTGATSNREDSFKFGTVGKALPGWELKLAEDGELLIRSPTVFAGYYKDEEATRAILDDDGWLATGDIATIDEDGFVTITDRKKDILVTAGGKNVAPQNLENELKTSRFVSQALVVGDPAPYVAALITLDPVEIAGWAKRRASTATS